MGERPGMAERIFPGWPAPANVRAFTTTRSGGVSQGRWASLNLGDRCGDAPGAVAENRRRLRQWLPAEPAWLRQIHGAKVVEFNDDRPAVAEADAIVSRAAGQVCAVLTADCLPVLFCDRQGCTVAAAHAGWRGLRAGVLENTVRAMRVDPRDVLAWLGPGIGAGVYEVGDEVREAFVGPDPATADAFVASRGRWLADLYAIARQRLAGAGVAAVHGGNYCTYTDKNRFYSHRRDGGSGRMATVAWLGV